MNRVFIYWDNSNIFISAQQTAVEREGETARYRTHVHFRNLLELAHAGRPIERAVAVGSIPPELRHVWNACTGAAGASRCCRGGAVATAGCAEWAEATGKFIALDDFHDSVTFLEPPAPGRPAAEPRTAVPVDLSRRP